MKIQIASFTDPGGRERNEDSFRVEEYGALRLAVLADGAGGHGGGDLASKLVVDTAAEALLRRARGGAPVFGSNLVRALLEANDAVLEGQNQGGRGADMRSTAVVLAVDADLAQASWAHCGDSRLYWLRNGAVQARTKDHSLVQSMVDAGMLDADKAPGHPQRNVLLSALGSADDLDIAGLPEPADLREGDAFLLCTDGLWDYLDDAFIAAALSRAAAPADWLADLAAAVRAKARPGHDNYTAIAVWIGLPGDVTIIRPRAAAAPGPAP
ncbi:protein phosphatase 2C domain-containing protein [Pigmentiphaga soli]|uniref:Protein phosphatase 2C domain-containing protein n=1 Tax=Pigmentiphaga soli TaxID=1007095 RepID=A0ABP8HNY8_9BURK